MSEEKKGSEGVFTELFGSKLLKSVKEEGDTESLLADKEAVLVYFSAHWCGPCRGFTPQLIEKYKELMKTKKTQLVFVSSDRDQAAFDEYYGSMPWLALPFPQRDTKAALSAKYKVKGIPTLVVLDGKTGKLITDDGRSAVSDLSRFPWHPPSFDEAIGNKFVNAKGEEFDRSHLNGKSIGLYFSAHWCPPCKKFTPMLADTYKTLKAANKDVEVVFVSGDRGESEFKEYLSEMPWIAVPFSDKATVNMLNSRYKVEGIPTFVMVDGTTGKTINKAARGAVSEDPKGTKFPWEPEPVNVLSGGNAAALNDGPGVIAFCDEDCDASTEKSVLEALTPEAAKVMKAAADADEDPSIRFFLAKDHPVINQVKHLMEMGGDGKHKDTVLAILDITQGGSFHHSAKNLKDLTADSVCTFVKDFRAGKIEKTPLHTHSHGGHGGHH